MFSVPESVRDKRHQLRSSLQRLGFGTVAAGVWVAPAHLHDDTVEVLARYQLMSYVDLFRADHLGSDVARHAPVVGPPPATGAL